MEQDDVKKPDLTEKQNELNRLLEEINIVKSKKSLYINRSDLLRE